MVLLGFAGISLAQQLVCSHSVTQAKGASWWRTIVQGDEWKHVMPWKVLAKN